MKTSDLQRETCFKTASHEQEAETAYIGICQEFHYVKNVHNLFLIFPPGPAMVQEICPCHWYHTHRSCLREKLCKITSNIRCRTLCACFDVGLERDVTKCKNLAAREPKRCRLNGPMLLLCNKTPLDGP